LVVVWELRWLSNVSAEELPGNLNKSNSN